MKNICKIRFGSHLYGTNTPESDEDFIGVFVPSLEEMLLGRIPKTANSSAARSSSAKNLPGEEDSTWFSLHHFTKMACQGQTIAMDMLWAPDDMIEPGPYFWIWQQLQAKRKAFLSKDMKAFVGYARGQATKYSLKGERLEKLEEAFAILMSSPALGKLSDKRQALIDAGCTQAVRTNPQGVLELQIGGKWFGESTAIINVVDSISKVIRRYGKRADAAREAGGVDWKAMSHAVRVSMELIDLLTYSKLEFPLPYAADLLEIKKGKRSLEDVQAILDIALREIECLMATSRLPEKVDHKIWDDWLYEILLEELKRDQL